MEMPKEDKNDLKVNYSTWETINFYGWKLKVAVPFITLALIIVFAQFFLINRPKDIRTKAEVPAINVKDAPYGAKGDGTTDDTTAIKNAINAQVSGGKVLLPPGRYKVTSPITLKSGITISGYGATVYNPPRTTETSIFVVNNTDSVSFEGLTITSDFVNLVLDLQQRGSYLVGIHGNSTTNLTIKDFSTSNLDYSIAFVGGVSKNLTIDNMKTYNDSMPIYLEYTQGGHFTNMDLHARTDASKYEHHFYLAKKNSDLLFENVRLRGGVGYSVHLYNSGGTTYQGQRITFRNLILDNVNEGPVVWGYDNTRFEGLYGNATGTAVAPAVAGFFVFRDINGLTVDGFDVSGTNPAFYSTANSANVVLSNGKYHQSTLMGNGSTISGYTATNVVHDSNPFVLSTPAISQPPTSAPSASPTNAPTSVPAPPTAIPTAIPTPIPTRAPTVAPTPLPTYGVTVSAVYKTTVACPITASNPIFSGTTSYTRTSGVPVNTTLTAPGICNGRRFFRWSTGSRNLSINASDSVANNGNSSYVVYYK